MSEFNSIKEYQVTIQDKLIVPGGYKYYSGLYLILKPDNFNVYDKRVSPIWYTEAKIGDKYIVKERISFILCLQSLSF